MKFSNNEVKVLQIQTASPVGLGNHTRPFLFSLAETNQLGSPREVLWWDWLGKQWCTLDEED